VGDEIRHCPNSEGGEGRETSDALRLVTEVSSDGLQSRVAPIGRVAAGRDPEESLVLLCRQRFQDLRCLVPT
jgi:hypothetical protein